MKSRTLTCVTAMTLFSLALPPLLVAQGTRYKLIDIPTLAGPAASGQGLTLYVGPGSFSRRYVVCLLNCGYKWPGSSGNSPASVPTPPLHGTESTSEPNVQNAPPTVVSSRPRMTIFELGHDMEGVAFTKGAVWVTYSDGTKNKDFGVLRVDAVTYQVVASVRIGEGIAMGAAAGEGAVWISNFGKRSVSRIDPESNSVVATVAVGRNPTGLAVGEGSVWVANARDNTASRIDPKSNTVVATIPVGKVPAMVAVGGGFVWVTNWRGKSVSRIDPKTNAVVATIAVDGEAKAVTASGNDIWISCQLRSGLSIQRIDAKSNRVVAKTTVGKHGLVSGTALLDGVLWVADRGIGALWKIDIQTNAVVGEPIPVGADPQIFGMGIDGNGAIWLTNPDYGTLRKVQP